MAGCPARALGCPTAGDPTVVLQLPAGPATAASLVPDRNCSSCGDALLGAGYWRGAPSPGGLQSGPVCAAGGRPSWCGSVIPRGGLAAALPNISRACCWLDTSHKKNQTKTCSFINAYLFWEDNNVIQTLGCACWLSPPPPLCPGFRGLSKALPHPENKTGACGKQVYSRGLPSVVPVWAPSLLRQRWWRFRSVYSSVRPPQRHEDPPCMVVCTPLFTGLPFRGLWHV